MPGADGVYNQSEDPGSEGATLASTDDSYASRTGQTAIPVQKDDMPVTDPIDPATADSDEQLKRDDTEAIDQSNIISGRTRGAGPSGGYTEPGDEEGLPADDGTSSA